MPAKPTAKALQSRWSIDVQNADDPAAALLEYTQNFTYSPFGHIDGKLDFRGFPFYGKMITDQPQWGLHRRFIEIKDLTIKRVDFSYALIENVDFASVCFEDALFIRSKWHDCIFRFGVSSFQQCDFTKAALSACSFFDTTFKACLFVETTYKLLRDSAYSGSQFFDCLFQTNLKGLNFGGACFTNTQFIGELYDVTFEGWGILKDHPRYIVTKAFDPKTGIGEGYWLETPYEMVPNKMQGVDFSKASMMMCNIRQYCYLHECYLPPKETHCVFELKGEVKEVLTQKINECYPANTHPAMNKQLLAYVKSSFTPHSTSPHHVVNIEDASKYYSQKEREIIFALVSETVDALGLRVMGRTKEQ